MPGFEGMVDFLRDQPVFTLFVILGCGYLLGNLRIAGIALGAVAGTLLIALVLGRFGFRISPAAQSVGFAMFIFSVGHQAGPRFVEVLKAQGLRYLMLAIVVSVIGVSAAVVAGKLLDLPPGGTAGLMAGALTTTPALAAAQNAVRDGIANIPAGVDPEEVIATIGTSYAITYVIGMIGLILAVKLLPRLAGVDLAAEARRMEAAASGGPPPRLQARAYRVSSMEFLGQPIEQLAKLHWDGLAVVRVRRQGVWHELQLGDTLQANDELCAYGDARLFQGAMQRIGDEIELPREFEWSNSLTQVVIARPQAVGSTLGALRLAPRHGLVVVEIRRDGMMLPVHPDVVLQRGDVISVVGPPRAVTALIEEVGPVEANANETDMMAFAFGIAVGSLLGLISVNVGGVPLGLGTAGGLLLAGILTGWLSSARPTIGKFPEAARWILMEFGLLIFICGVGLQAGSGIVETFREAGWSLIVAAVVVVILPVAGGYWFAAKVLKLDPVILMGALTGAMTSGPALSLVTKEAKSAAPALGYSGTYAFASILLAISGTIVMLIT